MARLPGSPASLHRIRAARQANRVRARDGGHQAGKHRGDFRSNWIDARGVEIEGEGSPVTPFVLRCIAW